MQYDTFLELKIIEVAKMWTFPDYAYCLQHFIGHQVPFPWKFSDFECLLRSSLLDLIDLPKRLCLKYTTTRLTGIKTYSIGKSRTLSVEMQVVRQCKSVVWVTGSTAMLIGLLW